MSAYSDSFTGANGSTLGANWTKTQGSNVTGDINIQSNQATGSSAGNWGVYTYASSLSTNDQYAQAVVPIAASGTQREVQIGIRVKPPVTGLWWPDGYYIGVQYSTGSTNRYMFGYFGGNYSNMGSAGTPAFTTGETIRIEAQGSAIRYLVNGTLAFQFSPETSLTGSTERQGAIAIYGGSALDDFAMGDIGGAAAAYPWQYYHQMMA